MADNPLSDPSAALANGLQDSSRSEKGERNEIFTPFWKPGSGHYGDTLGQSFQVTSLSLTELVLSFLDKVPVTQNEVFTVGDYGTNDGFASMPLFCSIIRRLRERHGEKLAIQIIYEDQEKNDFNSLFNRLCGADSPVSLFNNVFPLVTNVNFYTQCVPDASCHLIFSQAATHWLHSCDMTYKDTIFPEFNTEEERRRFRKEAERDWIQFLVLRARELKPGGLLVVSSLSNGTNAPGKEDHGDVTDDTRQDKIEGREGKPINYQIDLWLDLDAVWKQLRDEERITKEEYERCAVKVAFRTAEELTSPFESVSSPVRQAGLTLVHHDQIFQPCFYKTAWQRKVDTEGVDDHKSFADDIVGAHQVWNHTIFRTSLSDMRSEEEKAAILKELYRKFHSLVMTKDPGSYRSDFYMSRLVARKS